MNFLQEISGLINPTKINCEPYNLCKQTLYDFKMKRSENIWNKNKEIIINYLKDMIAAEDIKERLDFLIIKSFCKMYDADYGNIMHFKKGRLKSLSNKNIYAFDKFFDEVKNFIEKSNTDDENFEKPDFRYNDKVKVKFNCNEFNHVTFLNADPVLNHKKEWVAPCRIGDEGILYVPCSEMQLLRRIN